MNTPKEFTQAIKNFYAALNTLFTGNVEPMKAAWSHADDISFMGPEGTYLKGWQQIGPLWENVANAKLGGNVQPTEVQTIEGTDLALLTCIECGENISNGKAETVHIRSSTVFRLEDAGWKVVHHQTDLLSYLSNS